jgi:hypothetical protein
LPPSDQLGWRGFTVAVAILFGLWFWLAPSRARADTHHDRAALAQCAEARSDADRHRLRCWRFDTARRETYRSYDRDAEPSWKVRKAWE